MYCGCGETGAGTSVLAGANGGGEGIRSCIGDRGLISDMGEPRGGLRLGVERSRCGWESPRNWSEYGSERVEIETGLSNGVRPGAYCGPKRLEANGEL